jgi:tetratricopeptide (TPR) repeat protein
MSATGRELYDQGVACEQAGDAAGAFEAYRLSAKADPGIAAPFVGLARILGGNHQRGEAIACLERAIACEPRNAVIRVMLGRILSQDGKLQRARRELEEALRLDSAADTAAIELGAVCEDMGDRDEAAAVYARLLKARPGHAAALAGLLGVADADALEAAIGAAAPILQAGDDRDAAAVAYALGKALARRGRDDEAFAAWDAANAARRRAAGPFDRAAFDARVDVMIEIFTADFFAARRGWGDPSQRPVFIVGLPRSGTSLTEQVLASHPAVFGAGELDILTDLATGTPDRLGRLDLAWPQTAPALGQQDVAAIAVEHLARLAALAPGDAQRVIDK